MSYEYKWFTQKPAGSLLVSHKITEIRQNNNEGTKTCSVLAGEDFSNNFEDAFFSQSWLIEIVKKSTFCLSTWSTLQSFPMINQLIPACI